MRRPVAVRVASQRRRAGRDLRMWMGWSTESRTEVTMYTRTPDGTLLTFPVCPNCSSLVAVERSAPSDALTALFELPEPWPARCGRCGWRGAMTSDAEERALIMGHVPSNSSSCFRDMFAARGQARRRDVQLILASRQRFETR